LELRIPDLVRIANLTRRADPMPTPIRMPDVAADAASLRVSCWLVDMGDRVEPGDRVVELLTAGMTFDVSAPVAGRLTRINKPLDAAVGPGEVLGWIDTSTRGELA